MDILKTAKRLSLPFLWNGRTVLLTVWGTDVQVVGSCRERGIFPSSSLGGGFWRMSLTSLFDPCICSSEDRENNQPHDLELDIRGHVLPLEDCNSSKVKITADTSSSQPEARCGLLLLPLPPISGEQTWTVQSPKSGRRPFSLLPHSKAVTCLLCGFVPPGSWTLLCLCCLHSPPPPNRHPQHFCSKI